MNPHPKKAIESVRAEDDQAEYDDALGGGGEGAVSGGKARDVGEEEGEKDACKRSEQCRFAYRGQAGLLIEKHFQC
jgi:hypothetical protein